MIKIFISIDTDLSQTFLNEVDQELEIKWAKNRPTSPLSTLQSFKSTKEKDPMLINCHFKNSEITSQQKSFNLFGKSFMLLF